MQYQFKKVSDYEDIDQMVEKCYKKFKLEGSASDYGLKNKAQGIIIRSIDEIDKSRKNNQEEEDIMADKDFYDENLKTDELVLISLSKEAERHVRQLNQCKNHIEKLGGS